MTEEIIDLENVPVYPEFYKALNHSHSAVQAIPFIRDIAYFKLQTLRNEGNIIDVD